MNTHSKKGILACLVVLFMGVTSARAAEYKVRWLIGHADLDYFGDSAAKFKAAVEQGSHGKIAVEIVPAVNPWEDSPTGRATPEIAAKVERGEAEMGHSFTTVLGKLDPRLGAFELPYLFESYGHLEGVLEGPVGSDLLNGLRAHNIVGLAFTFSGGAQGVSTLNREIRSPEDLKGLKLGTFGDAIDTAWLTSLGATPVSIEHRLAGILPRTQNGELDSVTVTWRRIQESRLNERYKYVNLMGSTYLVSVTYINERFLASLPEAYRTLVIDSAKAAARIERAKAIELNSIAEREMVAKGLIPVHLSKAGRLKFQEALRPVYSKALAGIVGKGLIEKIRKTSPNHKLPSAYEVAQREEISRTSVSALSLSK